MWVIHFDFTWNMKFKRIHIAQHPINRLARNVTRYILSPTHTHHDIKQKELS